MITIQLLLLHCGCLLGPTHIERDGWHRGPELPLSTFLNSHIPTPNSNFIFLPKLPFPLTAFNPYTLCLMSIQNVIEGRYIPRTQSEKSTLALEVVVWPTGQSRQATSLGLGCLTNSLAFHTIIYCTTKYAIAKISHPVLLCCDLSCLPSLEKNELH